MLFSQTYREQAILTGWKPNIEFWLLKGNGRISEIVCEEIVRLLTGPDYGYIFTEEQARSWLKLKVALCKKELIEEGRLETEEEKLIPFSEKQGKEPS